MRKDIAKFAIAQALYDMNMDNTDVFKLCDPECWAENHGIGNDLSVILSNLKVCGWSYANFGDPFSPVGSPGSWYCGKKGNAFGPQWNKGELKIWIVNETEYPAAGENVGTIIANDEPSIAQFKQDCGHLFDPKCTHGFPIETDYIVVLVDG